jgi:hypothetical protein
MPAKLPFQILGTSDDGQLCFLDRGNRFKQTPPRALNKSFLQVLAQIEWWRENYRHHSASDKTKDPVDWDKAIDDMLEISTREFDFSNTKGIGAWRSPDGEICYHNGNPAKITGEHPDNWVFIRKSTKDIGLSAGHTSLETRKEILNTVKSLAFETWQDGIRLLCWSTLAPFAGALPWRCSGLLTGKSGGGKSAVIDYVVRPIVGNSVLFASGGSTEAGIRQMTAVDAIPVILEEVEADTQRERENRDGLFKLMRQSTSDHTPAIYKGGKDGVGQSFNLKCMFLFVGISPEVEKEADENRLFFCNIKNTPEGGDKSWVGNRKALKRLMTKQNMDGIRALIWEKLPTIIDNIHKLESVIQDETKLGGRQATAEAPLLAAYITIWLGLDNPTTGQVKRIVKEFYDGFEIERRDETREMVEKLLDISVNINEEDIRGKYTIREMLITLNKNKKQGEFDSIMDADLSASEKNIFKKTLMQCGVALSTDKYKNCIGIAKNHPFIMDDKRGLGLGKGYHKQIFRHSGCVDKGYPISVNGDQRAYVILEGVL